MKNQTATVARLCKLPGMPRDPKLVIGQGFKQRLTKAGVAAEMRFNALVNAYLATIGTKPGRFGYEWRVETVAGAYDCGARGHMIVGSFVDPARVKALGFVWLNEYSGKWNHHYTFGAGEEELDNFKRQIERILPKASK